MISNFTPRASMLSSQNLASAFWPPRARCIMIGIRGVDRLGTLDAGLQQSGQLIQVADVALGPEQAVVDLVPDLDHVGQGALALQGPEDRGGVAPERILQRRVVEIGPCQRLVLLLGIGPVVAVVEVQQEPHPRRLIRRAMLEGRIQAAEPTAGGIALGVRRIDEDPEPDVVEAMTLQQRDGVDLLAVIVERPGSRRRIAPPPFSIWGRNEISAPIIRPMGFVVGGSWSAVGVISRTSAGMVWISCPPGNSGPRSGLDLDPVDGGAGPEHQVATPFTSLTTP